MPRQLLERAAGERADRVEGDVAEQLDPDLVAEARRHRAAQAGGDQRVGQPLGPLALAAVGLAQAEAVALDVADHARLGQVGGEVGERSDDAAVLDGAGDDAAGIDPLQPQVVQLAADALEVPPRDAVLGADDDGVGSEQRRERRRQRGQRVGLHAEDDDVGVADRRQVAGDRRAGPRTAPRRRSPARRAPASPAGAGRGRTAPRRRRPAPAWRRCSRRSPRRRR